MPGGMLTHLCQVVICDDRCHRRYWKARSVGREHSGSAHTQPGTYQGAQNTSFCGLGLWHEPALQCTGDLTIFFHPLLQHRKSQTPLLLPSFKVHSTIISICVHFPSCILNLRQCHWQPGTALENRGDLPRHLLRTHVNFGRPRRKRAYLRLSTFSDTSHSTSLLRIFPEIRFVARHQLNSLMVVR